MHQDDGVGACRNRRAGRPNEGQREKGEHEHEPDEAELGERLEVERMGVEGTAAHLDQP